MSSTNDEVADNTELQNSPTLQSVDDQLIVFLRRLADSIERKQLEPQQLGRVGEFFMNYLFHEEMEDVALSPDDKDRKEFMKFLSLGWYIHTFLLKDTEEEDEESDEIKDEDDLLAELAASRSL